MTRSRIGNSNRRATLILAGVACGLGLCAFVETAYATDELASFIVETTKPDGKKSYGWSAPVSPLDGRLVLVPPALEPNERLSGIMHRHGWPEDGPGYFAREDFPAPAE